MEFPKFDGTNPQLWRDCYEMYYEVYVVPIINHEDAFHRFELSCPAAIWLQTVERRGPFQD